MQRRFDNLPPITPRQADALAAYFSALGSLVDVADHARMTLSELLDCLSAPAVQEHIRRARELNSARTHNRIAEAAHGATHVLEQLAHDPELDKTERRRAATTLIRALNPPRGRRRTRLINVIKSGAADSTNAPQRHGDTPGDQVSVDEPASEPRGANELRGSPMGAMASRSVAVPSSRRATLRSATPPPSGADPLAHDNAASRSPDHEDAASNVRNLSPRAPPRRSPSSHRGRSETADPDA